MFSSRGIKEKMPIKQIRAASSIGIEVPKRNATASQRRHLATSQDASSASLTKSNLQTRSLTSARPSTSGIAMKQRSIQDRSYYATLLRTRIRALRLEMERLNNEKTRHELQVPSSTALEQTAEPLALEIRQLESTLMDYNFLLNKCSNNNINLDQLREEWQKLKENNDQELKMLDDLFEEKQNVEKQLKNAEEKLNMEKQRSETTFKNMENTFAKRYEAAEAKKLQLKNEIIKEKENTLNQLLDKQEHLKQAFQTDAIKSQALERCEKLIQVENIREQLRDEVKNYNASDQQKESLLRTIKHGKKELQTIEKQITRIKNRVEKVEKKIATKNEPPDDEEMNFQSTEYFNNVDEEEKKITDERSIKMNISKFRTQIQQLCQEMQKYENVEQLRENVENKKKELTARKQLLQNRLNTNYNQLNVIQQNIANVEEKLNQNEKYKQLINCERKLWEIENNIKKSKQAIADAKANQNINLIKDEVLNLISKYNTILVNHYSEHANTTFPI
ncbi:Intraflagellar transport protein 74 -like protein [Trichinella pseudospiralis]|uniref:Intraflagellar transport protein 74-like protein n=1 Tax=Trichinella pseudospiralis TaxID=6337 RepID=A0A0V1FC81_TRIPS|nr:Intraflagellar transport protein 74 -like protein [Trichinella pseudospiralis]